MAIAPTPEQAAAIEWAENMVVTACPGSGKTAVISEKVRNILPGLPNHMGVIAISYTNKASDELRRRCKKRGVDVKRSFFGTIDSFCITEIIFPFAGHVFVGCRTPLVVRPYKSACTAFITPFGEADRERVMQADKAEDILDILTAFLAEGVVILEAVAVQAVYIAEKSLACKRYLKSRFSHLFVDEYQDAGAVQHSFFTSFKALGVVSIAVGDANQSIFKFARRDSRYLLELCSPESGYRHFPLTVNHRSHPSIVNYSQRLLDPSCALLETDRISVFRLTIDGLGSQLGPWIDERIEKFSGKLNISKASDIAILSVGGKFGIEIASQMQTASRVYRDTFLDRSDHATVQPIIDILKLRRDSTTTIQSILDSYGITRGSRSKIRTSRSMLSACRHCPEPELLAAVVLAVKALVNEEIPQEMQLDLELLIQNADQMKNFDRIRDDEIQIMTLHKSKGLEFDIVFHVDLLEWVFPKKLIAEGKSYYPDFDQALNLHYVGVTRARKACVLVSSTKRLNASGDIKSGAPSEFLNSASLDGLFKVL